jgi:hypothetical protein
VAVSSAKTVSPFAASFWRWYGGYGLFPLGRRETRNHH